MGAVSILLVEMRGIEPRSKEGPTITSTA